MYSVLKISRNGGPAGPGAHRDGLTVGAPPEARGGAGAPRGKRFGLYGMSRGCARDNNRRAASRAVAAPGKPAFRPAKANPAARFTSAAAVPPTGPPGLTLDSGAPPVRIGPACPGGAPGLPSAFPRGHVIPCPREALR